MIKHDPRSETFIEMLKYSICPLLKKNSFTYWICLFDIIYYLMIVIYQQTFEFSLRPQQSALFHSGQLYPKYAYSEIWRLILSLEQHRNESHLIFSLIIKLHYYSYVEHQLGKKQTTIIYLVSGISGTLLQSIFKKNAGYFNKYYNYISVCGSFHAGIVVMAYYLQVQMLQKCSPSQQLQYYFDYQQSQNVMHSLCKIFGVFFVLLFMSARDAGILFTGTIAFMIQSFLLGQYYQNDVKRQSIQLINNQALKKEQLSQYFLMSGVLSIFIGECIVFWRFTTLKAL